MCVERGDLRVDEIDADKVVLIRIWPSLGSGTGRSVRYCSTSVPPFFSMITPFIVLGMEDIARVVVWVRLLVREESCNDMVAARRVELVDSSVRAVNMELWGVEGRM